MNRSVVLAFLYVFVLSTLYRVVPFEMRPEWLGAPQLAMALFAGAVIADKKVAFAFPLFSMLLSDVVMQILHLYNPSYMPGFYEGQFSNYLLIILLTVIGFFTNPRKLMSIAGGAIAAPVAYWLLSNFMVWIGGGGLQRPKTFSGLMTCYADALPFLRNSLAGTLVFASAFFGLHAVLQPKAETKAQRADS